MRDECPLSEVRAPSQHPPSRTSESHGLLTNLLILVPLYRSEVPDRIGRLWSRDFRSAVLATMRIRWRYIAVAVDAGSAGRLASSACKVTSVEWSATPSTRAGRKWRWKAVTTSMVALSYFPVIGTP